MRERTHVSRTRRVPNLYGKEHDLHGHIVHHKGKQSFVGIPFCLENGRDHSPKHTSGHARDEHDRNQYSVRDFSAEIEHAHRTGEPAHEYLSFRARIPKTHFECGSDGERDQKKNRSVTEKNQDSSLSPEDSRKHRRINEEGIFFQNEKRQ